MASLYIVLLSSVVIPLVTILCLARIKQKDKVKHLEKNSTINDLKVKHQEKLTTIDTLKELVDIKTQIIEKLK
jgi:hypothetical protein